MNDLVVHVRDPKTGRVIESRDYAMIIDNQGTRFERPIGSGKFFSLDPNGFFIPLKVAPAAEAAPAKVESPQAVKR